MHKRDLILKLSERMDTTQKQAGQFIDELVDIITDAVKKGEKVTINNFATFEKVKKKATTGRNPRTGEKIDVPARKVGKIKAAKNFRDLV